MTYPPFPAPRRSEPARRRRRWPWIVAGVAAVLVGAGGIIASTTDRTPVPTYPAATSTPTPAVAAVEPAPNPPPAPTPPAGPRTTFGDGTWEVGVDIPPGKYKSPGTGYCYWARLKTGDGSLGDIIDNDISKGPSTVTIKPSDGYFKANRCATWTKS